MIIFINLFIFIDSQGAKFWSFPSRTSLEVPRVPCLIVYLWCQGCQVGRAPQEIPLKFQGWHATCPSRIQWLRVESIGAMIETTIISYVASHSETNGIGDQGIRLDVCHPVKSSWVTQIWDLPSWHHELQGEGVSTFPTQVTAGVLANEIKGIVTPLPCSSIQLVQPHYPYVSHSTKQLICACNH